MRTRLRPPCGLLPLCLSLGLALPSAAQDTPESGYEVQDLPVPLSGTLWVSDTFSNGDLLVFDGLTVDRYDAGGLVARLATLPAFAFPSFVRIAPGELFCVIGESSLGTVQRVDLIAGGATLLATLPFNYDAVFEDADHLWVSATASGFGLGNEIWRLELSTATATQIATVPGASGPLAFAPDGDLLYATVSDQFPAPPGQTQLLSWDASVLQGPFPLDETAAVVLAAGLEAGGSLAVEPSTGRVFLAENDFATGVGRILAIPAGGGSPEVLLSGRPGWTLGSLEYVPAPGPAEFRPYQPPGGGLLRYHANDFSTGIERWVLQPHRPQLSLQGPGTQGPGPFDALLTGGPPGGLAVLLYGPTALFDPMETAYPVAGLPLFLGLDLPTLTVLPGVVALDGTGALQVGFHNSGALFGFTAQLVVFDGGGVLMGSSTAASL